MGWGAATVCREDHAGHGHLPTTVSEKAKALTLLKNKGGLGLTICQLPVIHSQLDCQASISVPQRTPHGNSGTTVSSFCFCNEVPVGSGVGNEMPRVPW